MKASNLVVAAYFLHLLVPALLLLDVVTSGLRGEIALKPASAQGAVAAFAALWLFGGLGLFFLSRNRQAFVRRIAKPLLSVYAFYLMFGCGEVFARAIGLTPPIPF